MERKNRQDSPVVLVTGGAQRIGAAIGERFHEEGYRVAIHCYRSTSEAEELCHRLNQLRKDSAQNFVADLTRRETPLALIEQVIGWAGRLDVLVNNASVFIKSDLTALNEQTFDALLATNVKAPFYLSLAARHFLALQKGVIVNITDIHAESPLKGYSEYCQSKAALLMQTKALAREFAPDIRVNAVAPGAIAWPTEENALSKEQQQKIIAKTPLKRHGDARYIAQAVLALVQNLFITGQTLRVDGGRMV